MLYFAFNIVRLPLVLVFTGTIIVGTVSASGFQNLIIVQALFYSSLLCFVAFSLNDYFDREIDQLNGKRGGVKGEIIQESWQKKIAIGGSLLTSTILLASLPFLSQLAKYSVLGLLLIAFLYSVPPIRLKAVPILDSVTNGIGAFLFFALGTGLAGGNFSDIIPAGYWGSKIFMAIDAMGSCPDIEADKENGIRTSATLLGWRGTSIWFTASIIVSLIFQKWDLIPKIGHMIGIIFGTTMYFKRTEEWFYTFVEYSFYILTLPSIIWILFEVGLFTL